MQKINKKWDVGMGVVGSRRMFDFGLLQLCYVGRGDQSRTYDMTGSKDAPQIIIILKRTNSLQRTKHLPFGSIMVPLH